MLPPFALERPDRLDEALGLLDDVSVPYCGGTELLMAMKMNVLRPRCLVDLKGIAELGRLDWDGDDVLVGGAVTHARLATDDDVLSGSALLASVERRVGNARVRSQGSIGGNLCFAEPRSDIATLLCAMEASVTLQSQTDSREVAMRDFLIGAYETVREPGELLVNVLIPKVRRYRGVYLKYQYSERPTVGVALVHDEAEGPWRLAVGAVGEIPLVLEADSPSGFDPHAVAESIDLVEDLSGSVEYKRHIVEVYVRRAMQLAIQGDSL
ncbi:MAG: Molybdopterin dehydrogenase, FAD-binding [Acidimicrobiaceae bacterium]|nr:Molybdopterin dehydrogenase, FAD-binding [Acidimicrobiaceae bacterium]